MKRRRKQRYALNQARDRLGNIDVSNGVPEDLVHVPGPAMKRLTASATANRIPYADAIIGIDYTNGVLQPLISGIVVTAVDHQKLTPVDQIGSGSEQITVDPISIDHVSIFSLLGIEPRFLAEYTNWPKWFTIISSSGFNFDWFSRVYLRAHPTIDLTKEAQTELSELCKRGRALLDQRRKLRSESRRADERKRNSIRDQYAGRAMRDLEEAILTADEFEKRIINELDSGEKRRLTEVY